MERPITALAFIALTCLSQLAAAGKPGSGGTPPPILPVVLGASDSCAGSLGLSINNGVPRQVAGQGYACPGGQPRPILWTESTGMLDLGLIGGAGGASAEGVSDDGTVVGWLAGGVGLAFVRPLGGPMVELPKLPGMTYASAGSISSNGEFIVGGSSTDTEFYGVRWDRSSGAWQPTKIPSGGAAAVSDGGVVAGSVPAEGIAGEARVRVWSESGSVQLSTLDTRANGMNSAGTIVVGYRLVPVACRRPPCDKYEIPMVWTLTNGQWIEQQLTALDGVDSEANGVATVRGQTVVVGYGYTKKDAVMRAVFWKADAQGNFGAPSRLAGLDGLPGAFASAEGVNPSGQVVGYSGILNKNPTQPSTIFAVIWQLP